jgi:NADH-quinone oxidoreductase subunit C
LSSAEGTATETEEQAPQVDEVRQGLLDTLTAELGDGLVGSHLDKGDLWIRVRPDAWRRTAELCRDRLACDYFCFLSGIDWMPSSVPNPEEAAADTPIEGEDDDADGGTAQAPVEPEEKEAVTPEEPDGWKTGVAGGDTRFQVFARYASTTKHSGITVKADLDDDAPLVESIVPVYRGAEWHERETWEMYGFEFAGHPGLRHLYLPGEFEGHPLRKDFPLLAREVKPWPGLVDVEPMPGEDDGGSSDGGDDGGSA